MILFSCCIFLEKSWVHNTTQQLLVLGTQHQLMKLWMLVVGYTTTNKFQTLCCAVLVPVGTTHVWIKVIKQGFFLSVYPGKLAQALVRFFEF